MRSQMKNVQKTNYSWNGNISIMAYLKISKTKKLPAKHTKTKFLKLLKFMYVDFI